MDADMLVSMPAHTIHGSNRLYAWIETPIHVDVIDETSSGILTRYQLDTRIQYCFSLLSLSNYEKHISLYFKHD